MGDNVLGDDGFGVGKNEMRGGQGDDTYFVDYVGDTVFENYNRGTDLVQSSVSFSMAGQFIENLTLTGKGSINGTGNGLANILLGGEGNNVLDGGAGADEMRGGQGNDTYIVDNAGDTVFENYNRGTDLVQSSVSFSLAGQYIENLTLTGKGNINGTGNGQANILLGNTRNNILDGGTGADEMRGGQGDDTFIVDDVGDTVFENYNRGTDLVLSSVSFSVAGQHVENLVLTGTGSINGTGNGLDNRITGNSGNNVLTGGDGSDFFVFNTALGASNIDVITDFNVALDTIRLDDAIFSAIVGRGTLSAGQFVANSSGTAQDSGDRIIYRNRYRKAVLRQQRQRRRPVHSVRPARCRTGDHPRGFPDRVMPGPCRARGGTSRNWASFLGRQLRFVGPAIPRRGTGSSAGCLPCRPLA